MLKVLLLYYLTFHFIINNLKSSKVYGLKNKVHYVFKKISLFVYYTCLIISYFQILINKLIKKANNAAEQRLQQHLKTEQLIFWNSPQLISQLSKSKNDIVIIIFNFNFNFLILLFNLFVVFLIFMHAVYWK